MESLEFNILLFFKIIFSKKIEQEASSIINFFLLIFERILMVELISVNSTLLKFFLKEG